MISRIGAMKNIYATKILVLRVKLQDPKLQLPQYYAYKADFENTLKAARAKLAMCSNKLNKLGYVVPETNPTPSGNSTTMEDSYEDLKFEYNALVNSGNQDTNTIIGILQKLIWYATQLGLTEEAEEWQTQLDEL